MQAVNLCHDAAHAQMDVKFRSHLPWPQVRPAVTLMCLLLWPQVRSTVTLMCLLLWPQVRPAVTLMCLLLWPQVRPTVTLMCLLLHKYYIVSDEYVVFN